MPRKSSQINKHKITPDLILDLYKEAQKMETAEKEETVAKIKDLIKYMGKEIVVDLSDV
jgi:hypothetical protein|tara:strand:+ start:29 stop:205 length:177 start_codon:yes stop_codon:yes gene_type:complete